MDNFSAQDNDDVMTMENNWKVREHAHEHWRDSGSNPYFRFLHVPCSPTMPAQMKLTMTFN